LCIIYSIAMSKIPSLAVLIIGVIFILWGLNASESFGSDVSRLFTGEPTDRTIWLLVIGIVLAGIGLTGSLRSRRTN